MENSEEQREAVLAIQGGGIFGLTLVGQLQAVIDHGYSVLALAGTSAGAIVATLAWAGYSPNDMRELFTRLATSKGKNTLGELLGPFDPAEFDANAFNEVKQSAIGLLESLGAIGGGELSCIDEAKNWWKARKLIKTITPHVKRRGFFSGANLEARIERWIRTGMPVVNEIVPEGEPLRFHHVAKLMRDGELYVPPLLLTVTNLTKKRMEVISSIDARYSNVPIAKAVRASAGFPVFFQPTEMTECPEGGWFVDGGVVSNFPIWTLSDVLRNAMERSHLEDIYRPIIHKPWIRIGLRVVDDVEAAPDLAQAGIFFESLWGMLSGGARNELEELLAAGAARSVVVRQPYSETGGPEDALNISELDETRINTMVSKGYAFANNYLDGIKYPTAIVSTEEVSTSVRKQLGELIQRCDLVFQQPMECRFRANVFLPVMVGYEPRMRLVHSWNMDGDPDQDIEFPDLESGLTGFCYFHRHPQACNLEMIGKLRAKEPERYGAMFGMPRELQLKVKEDRSWLASIPIFDPRELIIGRSDEASRKQLYKGLAYSNVETEFEGPVLGVLNLDAGWSYCKVGLDENPDSFVFEPRIQTILAIMQAASFGIASTLSGDVPRQ